MPAKKLPSKDEKPQRERFEEAANKAGGVDSKAFDRAIEKIVPSKSPKGS